MTRAPCSNYRRLTSRRPRTRAPCTAKRSTGRGRLASAPKPRSFALKQRSFEPKRPRHARIELTLGERPVTREHGIDRLTVRYQSPTRFWYATTNGKIEYFNGSSFVPGAGITAGENFTDLAFQPTSVPGGPGTSGLYGYAVASNGDVWQTFNGGLSWTPVPPPLTPSDCTDHPTIAAETELNAVVWSSSSTVYLLGNNSTLAKSSAANTPTPAFAEINKHGNGTCSAQSNTSATNLTDATFLATNPLNGFMISQDFGSLYATSNGFASGIKKSEMVNNFQGNPRLAQDPANPNRLWAVDHAAGGGGCNELCLQFSTDGGITATHATFPKDSNPSVGLYDISSQGGTEVTAGSGGEIFNSIDGTNFYLQQAFGALATENWRAEDAFDPAHAAVGGVGGALAVTGTANEIAPPRQAPSGSHPTTMSTAGATITIFKTVFVTGRTARYAPVKVSATSGRKF
ncbi:MAG: Photosynthesis system assembly factor, partial [Solirubrobacteraceae bacterium]|nr:Photosynthesis system assembly factor [Solirubrobacteraceae bacterium]